MHFSHTPNPRGRYTDGAGNRFEIIARQEQESFSGGGSTYMVGGRAVLLANRWKDVPDVNAYAAQSGLVAVSTVTSTAATAVSYDPTVSLMASTDVQSAIDEVDGRIDAIETALVAHSVTDNGDGSFTHDDGLGNVVTVVVDAVRDFAPATAYLANQVVMESGQMYRRIADGTSGASFDAAEQANWTAVQGVPVSHTVEEWAAATSYEAGEVVIEGGELYRRIAAGTSGASFDAAEEADWTILARVAFTGATDLVAGKPGDVPAPAAGQQNKFIKGDGTWGSSIPAWSISYQYRIGDVVRESDLIYYCTADHSSDPATFSNDAANWQALSAPAEPHKAEDWAASTAYVTDEVVVFGNEMYRSNSDRTSGATWDAAEEAEWTLVSSANYSGATATFAGVPGRVPGALTGEQNKFLTGTGSWRSSIMGWGVGNDYSTGDVVYDTTDLKIYRATAVHTSVGPALANDIANWEELSPTAGTPDYTGSTEGTASGTGVPGTSGTVPAPAVGDQNRVLRGDGTWGMPWRGHNLGDYYEVGDLVLILGTMYYCGIAHEATGPPNFNNFQAIEGQPHIGTTASDAGQGLSLQMTVAGDQNKFFRADGIWTSPFVDWVAGAEYTAGDVVVESDNLYRANVTHVADGTAFATDAANWDAIGAIADFTGSNDTTDGANGTVPQPLIADRNIFLRGDGTWSQLFPYWAASTAYEVGDTVRSGPYIYVCGTAHTAAFGFDPESAGDITNWIKIKGQEMSAATAALPGEGGASPAPAAGEQNKFLRGDATYSQAIPMWTGNHEYTDGDLVLDSDYKIYRANAVHVSDANFRSNDAAMWDEISAVGPHAFGNWTPSTQYLGDEVVAHEGRLIRSNAFSTSNATFDAAEEAKWTELALTFADAWETGRYYYEGELAFEGGTLYRRISNGVAGASFDAAEESNWDAAGGAIMTGADETNPGTTGAVPAPGSGEQNKFLRGDASFGTSLPVWATTYRYELGDIATYSSKIYRCNTPHTSDAATIDNDIAKWDVVVQSAQTYNKFIVLGDWGAPSGGYYSLVIPQAEHGIPTNSVALLGSFEDDGTDFVKVEADTSKVNKTTGDVTFMVPEVPDGRFAGKLVVG